MNHEITITTPELVNLKFKLAPTSKRIIASFIDTLISYIIIISSFFIATRLDNILNFFHIQSTKTSFFYIAFTILFAAVIPFVIIFFYYCYFELMFNGQTPGKKIFDIRVIQLNGQKLNFTAALLRNLLRFIDMGFFFIGVLGILFTQNKTRIGDLAANTIVIEEEKPKLELPKVEKQFSIDINNAVFLNNELFFILEDFLSRLEDIETEYKDIIIDKLANQISENLKIDNYLNLTKIEFLEQVYLNYINKKI